MTDSFISEQLTLGVHTSAEFPSYPIAIGPSLGSLHHWQVDGDGRRIGRVDLPPGGVPGTKTATGFVCF